MATDVEFNFLNSLVEREVKKKRKEFHSRVLREKKLLKKLTVKSSNSTVKR